MKYLLFIVLLVAVLITAGCVGGDKNTPVTPTQATVNSSDPIVGIWQWTTTDGSKLYTFSFFSDGRYSFTDSSDPNTLAGNWSKVRENEYLIVYASGKNQAIAYNPVTDTFSMPEYSQVLAYRLGKEPVKTYTATPTVVQVQDPIVGVWRLGAQPSFPDYDDRERFNADGTFVSSFYLGPTDGTYVQYGTWSAQGGNSYLVRYTNGGTNTFFYDPVENAIHSTEYTHLLLTSYQGDVVAGKSYPASTPTYSSQSSLSGSTHFSGYGDDTRGFSVTRGGGFIITGSYSGDSNFIVHITDSNGNIEEFVFNEIGTYTGRKIVRLGAGKYYLEVQGSGSWTIDISPS